MEEIFKIPMIWKNNILIPSTYFIFGILIFFSQITISAKEDREKSPQELLAEADEAIQKKISQ